MVCQGVEIMGATFGLEEFLVYPTTCFYYTYALLFLFIFLFLTFLIYNRERKDQVKPDMISAAGVSATAVLFLAGIATLIKTDSGISMLQQDIMMWIIGIWIVIVAIWFFKR
jgi:FtsH-binding integral membrane protein